MKKLLLAFCVLLFAACDLQPKISALPDTIGEFISTRYPALLADPDAQPEIYNSAVTDYGMYASPELYGGVATTDDYVLYASIDDYTLRPQVEPKVSVDYGEPLVLATSPSAPDDYLTVPMYGTVERTSNQITVKKGDTLYSLAKEYSTTVDELSELNNLNAPYSLSVGQKLKVPAVKEVAIQVPVIKTKVELSEITVAAGDTLYSLSRKYSIPVNDLAIMNKLSAPFALSVGQKLKVPKLGVVPTAETVAVRAADVPAKSTSAAKSATSPVVVKPAATKVPVTVKPAPTAKPTTVAAPKEKISSDPAQKLPTISKRSSSKFSWPVRGTILSSYGSKSNGLFNDGINIAAAKGTKVSASENGVVAYAGNEVKGMGNLVIVQHSDGWMTVYAHMDKLSVRRGVKVTVGQQIGTVGQTGKVDKSQLHFEIRKGTKAYDPASYLKK